MIGNRNSKSWFFFFILKLKAHGKANSIPVTPASVRLSTFSNVFSSETTGPIELKFHMETP